MTNNDLILIFFVRFIMHFYHVYVLDELFWAKDIIILFSQHGTHGVRAWLDVYHGMTSSYIRASDLPARAGSIQAAVILEFQVSQCNSF